MHIRESARQYEGWLNARLGGELDRKDIARKHDKMRDSPFSFLRATYWRWAEIIFDVCPDLASGPPVLAVGDIHLENYGTWRDVDGRLCWGVNDYDEAAEMPYALDLVRLTTSALLADTSEGRSPSDIGSAILRGYRRGLTTPRPIVLDRDLAWLRELVVVKESERDKFWKKLASTRSRRAPKDYIAAISEAMPDPDLAITTGKRTAGTGSLGRPRWLGWADWRGAPAVREAKALVTSAWARAHDRSNAKIRVAEIACGRFRPIDPWMRVGTKIIVRRLSPNNRKIDVEDASGKLGKEMLETMAFDLASAHLGISDVGAAIVGDLDKRKRGWLLTNAKAAAAAFVREHDAWAS
jgi:hypothetical protein